MTVFVIALTIKRHVRVILEVPSFPQSQYFIHTLFIKDLGSKFIENTLFYSYFQSLSW